MSAPELFDPLQGPPGGWSAEAWMERAYLEAFARSGSQALISNLRTRVIGLQSGGRVFPVTVNEAEYGDAYVCLPHTAYSLYAKAELQIVDAGPWTPALGLVADAAGALLKAAAVNQIVHLGNWMLSTNLHGGWRGENLDAMRERLIEDFPSHLLAVRSVNAWSDAELLETLHAGGWRLLPARQIYVTDDLEREWAPRKDTRRDLVLMARTPLRQERLDALRPGDAERIADLYDLLYLQRYSRLNPAFTPAFIETTHRHGVFDYAGFRDEDGRLAAIVGCFTRGGVLTTPIVGYDTRQSREYGLYRLASALLAQMAQRLGARLNGSAGSASFKRLRGARPVIEYTAYFVDHLSAPRRAVIIGLERLLNTVAVPIMQERGL